MKTTVGLGLLFLTLVAVLAMLAWPAAQAGAVTTAPAQATAPATPEPPMRRQAASALSVLPTTLTSQPDLHAWRTVTQAAGAEAIPELRQLALTIAHPAVVGACLAALGRLDAVAADAELLALLDDPRPRVRQDLVAALGASRDARAFALLTRVASGPDADLRPLAIQALGRIGGEPARVALRALAARATVTHTETAFLQTALRLAANPAADAPAGPRGVAPASQPAQVDPAAEWSAPPSR